MARTGPHEGRSAKAFDRGSKKRVERIRLRGNWSIEFWIFVILMLIMLFVAVPWLIKHPIEHHHAPRPAEGHGSAPEQ